MRFVSLVLRNLYRRPVRTTLTLIALATAVAAVVSLRGIAKGFTESFAGVCRSHAVDVVVSRQGTADRLSSSVETSAIDKIAAVEGVEKAAGVLLETLSLESQQIFGIPTLGVASDSWLRDDYRWTKPDRNFQPAKELAPNGKRLSVGVHLARRAALRAGEQVTIFDEPYRVDGIFESDSVWENGAILMPLEQLQELTGRDGQVTYINVSLAANADERRAEAVIEKIESIDPRLHAMTTESFVDTDTRMRLASAMAWMTSAIALAIGAIGTLNTMMTSVLERTREIGVLRAVGWSRRRVIRMILAEAICLAALASGLGVVIAIAAVNVMSRQDAVSGVLVPVVDAATLIEGVLLALLIGVLGALLPARKAASILPTEALGR